MVENLTEDDLKTDEYKRQERIKIEREKAAQALEKEEKNQEKINSVYLDLSGMPKIKGFSRGPEAMRQSCERLANFSSVMAPAGILIDFLGRIVDMRGLGLSGSMMIGLIGGVGTIMVAVAFFVAIFAIGAAIATSRKYNIKVRDAFRNSVIAAILTGGYGLIWLLISIFR